MAQPFSALEWESIYGGSYSATNDPDTLRFIWGGMPIEAIKFYLYKVERYIDRKLYQTANDWGDKRYGGPR